MGYKLTEIEEEQPIILRAYTDDNELEFHAILKKHVKDRIAIIDIIHNESKRLSFENVNIDLVYPQADDVPLLWSNVKVISYGENYALQTPSDGVRNNRRNSFRLAIAQTASFRMAGGASQQVMVRDISLTGFSISDRKRDLNLSIGDKCSIAFEDWGYQIALDGSVVRIEEREDMIIYGFSICNMCNDLSPYMSTKQRRNKNHG